MNAFRSRDASEVADAARRRADALAASDATALRALHHPELRWTTHRGELLDRESYIAGNTSGALDWHAQHLHEVDIAVDGDVAVLVAVAVDDIEREGVRETFRMRVTETWVRRAGTWACAAGHAGPLLPS